MLKIVSALALAALAPGLAAQPVVGPSEVAIDGAANGGIRDYYAEDERVIYLRDRTNRWFKATFVGICPDLLTTDTVEFKSDELGRFDRFGAVVTRSGRCQIGSLVRSAAPREKGKG